MNLDKKLLYKRILQLQNFAGCMLSYAVNKFENTSIFELERTWTDSFGNLQKSITYVLSDDNIKINLSDFGLYCTTLTKLSESTIKSLIHACNEFGIPCKPYEKK